MKVLIIGCGGQGAFSDAKGSGNEHKTISFAKALKENGDFEVYYFDKDLSKVSKAIEIWEGYWHTQESYDVVIISTPDDTHYESLIETIKLNPKLVICEKPLCNSVSEAKEIVKLYEEIGIPILVDYTRNFIPELIQLKGRKPIEAICYFNRGWMHTATHGISFFEMLGIKNYSLVEMPEGERYWNIEIKFEDGSLWQELRIGDMPVPSYYDHHTKYVIDNAYNFLEGKEELKCTAQDGLKALEIMERLCK